MSDLTADAITIARAEQQLEQERQAFEQRKKQNAQWNTVRLASAWVAVALLPMLLAVAATVIANASDFPAAVVSAAAGTLFVDAVGVGASLLKFLLSSSDTGSLLPTTTASSAVEGASKPELHAGQI